MAGIFVMKRTIMLSNVVSSGASNAAVEVEEVTGESIKYATNRAKYVLNSLGSLQGSKCIRGDNDKGTGDQSFTVNVPVTVFVAMDGRSDSTARAPEGFAATGESIGFSHSGSTTAEFRNPLYAKDFDAGSVNFKFRARDMASIFVMERTLMLSNVVSSGASNAAVEVEEVTGESIKYATNRDPWSYALQRLQSLQGSKFIRGDNDKGTGAQAFKVNVPVTVIVAMDGRSNHAALAPEGFAATGETIGFDHGSGSAPDFDMPLYAKDFDAGSVSFKFRGVNMAGIFVM